MVNLLFKLPDKSEELFLLFIEMHLSLSHKVSKKTVEVRIPGVINIFWIF